MLYMKVNRMASVRYVGIFVAYTAIATYMSPRENVKLVAIMFAQIQFGASGI